jgi:hypothetical protein
MTIIMSKEAFISKVVSDDLLMPYGLWRLMQYHIVPEERDEVYRLIREALAAQAEITYDRVTEEFMLPDTYSEFDEYGRKVDDGRTVLTT